MDNGEFDSSNLAWLIYKIFYGTDFFIEKKRTKNRKYSKLVVGDKEINMSGDTDFNFGPGWSHSIYHKFEKYLSEEPKDYYSFYKSQLKKCKKLYKSILNISLMPQTGNLQSTKKGIGNDRLDTFIWALDSYYKGETYLLFNNSSFANTLYLKGYLDLFKRDDGKAIYNYCSKIYCIGQELVDDLILSGKEAIDSPERVLNYMRLSFRFWCQKLNHIKCAMNDIENLLSEDEKKKIDIEIELVENELNNWFED